MKPEHVLGFQVFYIVGCVVSFLLCFGCVYFVYDGAQTATATNKSRNKASRLAARSFLLDQKTFSPAVYTIAFACVDSSKMSKHYDILIYCRKAAAK